MIRDDFISFNAANFIRSRVKVFRYFRQYLAGCRFTGVSSPVESVTTDDDAEFKGGALSAFCRERSIRQEFTTANSLQFKVVGERRIAMIESAGKAAVIKAGRNVPGIEMLSDNALWSPSLLV